MSRIFLKGVKKSEIRFSRLFANFFRVLPNIFPISTIIISREGEGEHPRSPLGYAPAYITVCFLYKLSFKGAPVGFCKAMGDGTYVNPINHSQYFFCDYGYASKCYTCATGVYFAECDLCLDAGSSEFKSF